MSEQCKNDDAAPLGARFVPPPEEPVRWSARQLNPAGVTLVGVSAALVVYGAFHTVEVRTIDADELAEVLEFHPFEEISDHQLIVDTTFTGVVRRNGALYSNYDRAAPPQKRACPT